jgi:hypothetical protein
MVSVVFTRPLVMSWRAALGFLFGFLFWSCHFLSLVWLVLEQNLGDSCQLGSFGLCLLDSFGFIGLLFSQIRKHGYRCLFLGLPV